ncbi:glutamate receptor 2-like [Temnothorax longispinosus]|uniref:glutamate receptor 2-like n=1 Tax=Temnothorax longispinosus TaxID=300112 RepID=UPI003A999585
MNGVIWSKTQKTFVPISSVPIFAMLQQERLKQSRALETHNFQLRNLTLTSFQELRFLEFYDNDMKVTGFCGELWTLLSKKLNFTLQPIRSNETSLGAPSKDKMIFEQGLLGIITRNETIAIPKVEFSNLRRLAADFTMPLWMNSHRLYIRNEMTHDSTWMAKVFSWKIWCFILVMCLLLSVCSFWSQTILARIGNNCRRSTISDHIFYTFGMVCNQSNIPNVLVGRSRILEVSLGLFCSILSMAFGALLFIYITKRINVIPPFNNLESLLTDTSYDVVTLEGSIADIMFKLSPSEPYALVRTAKRVVVASTVEEMFKLACIKGKKKYTVLQGEDEYKARGKIECKVIPVGQAYFKMWVASGIAKNFKYKRTIDLGILRLKEVGLWDELVDRWLTEESERHYNAKVKAIKIEQVSLVILMMCCGMITAFIILIIEKIVYAYQRRLS